MVQKKLQNKRLTKGDFLVKAEGLLPEERQKIVADMMTFVGSDVLLFRVQYPSSLRQKQDEKWGEILAWFAREFAAVPVVTEGIVAVEQPAVLAEKILAEMDKMSGKELLVFFKIAGVFTSLILGLAVMRKKLTVSEAFALSRLEEISQNERWGEDAEAVAARKAAELEAETFYGYLS